MLSIDKVFQSLAHGNEAMCEGCEHYRCWEERHPYGETTATQQLVECRCTDAKECEQARVYLADEMIGFEEIRR